MISDIKDKTSNIYVNLQFKLCNALILKSQGRYKSKVKAMELFREVINDEVIFSQYMIFAIHSLCEMLIIEGKIFGNMDYEEIDYYIDQLYHIGEKENSVIILSDAMIFKSRIYLLQNNINQARSVLNQAEVLVRNKKLISKTKIIAELQDDLLGKLEYWADVGNEQFTLSDKIDESKILQHINILYKTDIDKIETEIPIMFLIINSQGSVILKYNFSGLEFHEQYIGSFLTAINLFFENVFSNDNSIDRIKSKDYTILIRMRSYLRYCYIFKGRSYFAVKKINALIYELHNNSEYKNYIKNISEKYVSDLLVPHNISEIIKTQILNPLISYIDKK